MFNIEIPSDDIMVPVKNAYLTPNVSGIYKFYSSDNELLYIGKSNDIRSRVSSHVSGSTNTEKFYLEFSYLTCIFIDNPLFLDIIETYMINTLKPKYNKSKVFKIEASETNNPFVHKKKTEKPPGNSNSKKEPSFNSKKTIQKEERWVAILHSLAEHLYLTSTQLRKLHGIGGVRNTHRILATMEENELIRCLRLGENCFQLTDKGASKIGIVCSDRLDSRQEIVNILNRNESFISGIIHAVGE